MNAQMESSYELNRKSEVMMSAINSCGGGRKHHDTISTVNSKCSLQVNVFRAITSCWKRRTRACPLKKRAKDCQL